MGVRDHNFSNGIVVRFLGWLYRLYRVTVGKDQKKSYKLIPLSEEEVEELEEDPTVNMDDYPEYITGSSDAVAERHAKQPDTIAL